MRRKLRLEQLESRCLLSATSWIGTSGYWDQASNWSNGLPIASSTVTISPTSAATISLKAGEKFSVSTLAIGSKATLSLPNVSATNPTSNSLANGGFETPTATGSSTLPQSWGNWGTTALSTQYAYAGGQSLAMSGPDSGVQESLAVTAGASYTLSVDAMTPAGNPLTGSMTAQVQLLFYNRSGTLLSSYAPPNQIIILNPASAAGGPLTGSVGNQGWNQFSTTAVAPTGAATVSVQLVAYANATYGGAVYFDNVQFGPSPTGGAQLTAGSISNSGTIIVGSPDKIAVNGTYTQTSSGGVNIQLAGAPASNQYGTLAVSGAATLAGTLQATLVSGYAPTTTDAFAPITFASASGSFSTTTLPGGVGYQFAAAVTFTNVIIAANTTAAVTTNVSADTSLHTVATNLLGVNSGYWDSYAVPSSNGQLTTTEQMTQAAGLNLYRIPGGSAGDEYHFNVATNLGYSAANTIGQFVQLISQVGGTGVITLNYGSGSPQEAAAELAYLLGATSDTTALGTGLHWLYGASGWTSANWQTVGYWAALRAATPLKTDDGLNFLRLDHPAPFTNIQYWEVGNEEYGSWETDHHGTAGPGGVSTGAQHDPATYAAFAAQFATLAAAITATAGVPAISIGIDSGAPTSAGDNNWTQNVLADGLAIGFVPGFISDHSYMEDPGWESDTSLLNGTVTVPNSGLDWSTRYAAYQSVLQATLGSKAVGVQLMATELNSISDAPGKQTTSLVNGLFLANAMGGLLNSGYSGASVWDLRNDWETWNNNSNALYGWRPAGDTGILGTTGAAAPNSGPYVAYPAYYALQLASKIIVSGGQVVPATSSYSDLNVYAVMEANGDLCLLVVNTNPASAITDQITTSGFQPAGPVQVWQYGKTEDTAQSQSPTGASALSSTSTSVTLNGATFSYSFPAYSMTVLDLKQAPTIATAATATPATVTGKTSALSVLGGYNGGESNLTYTWATMGSPPAPVTFSANATNAAKNATATFAKAGSYNLQVTITDPAGYSATSTLSVTVSPTFAGISVAQSGSQLATAGTEQFSASALDQFDAALASQPPVTWSVTGGGQITTAGLYTPPYTSGLVTVKAASGSVAGTLGGTLPGAAQWTSTEAASWNASGTWIGTVSGTPLASPGLRGVGGDTVLFASASPSNVSLNGASPSVAAITFSGTGSVTIAQGSGGTIQLAGGTSAATLTDSGASSTISAPLELASNVVVNTALGSTLTISGAISGVNYSLTADGTGILALAGSNSYSGGTIVTGGTLLVESAAALSAVGNLVIRDGATVVLAFDV
jgi:alpha-L-arabinofuranosidase